MGGACGRKGHRPRRAPVVQVESVAAGTEQVAVQHHYAVDPMNPARSSSDVTRYLIIAIALLLVTAILWMTVDALVIAFGAIVVACVLRAAASPLQRWTGLSERWSVVLAVFILLVALGLLGWLFGAQTVRQFAELQERLPEATAKFQEWLARSRAGRVLVDGVKQATDNGQAVSNLDEILSVQGLDGVYVGPSDLSFSLGKTPTLDPSDKEVLAAMDTIVKTTRKKGLIAGVHTDGAKTALRRFEEGYQMCTILNDVRLLAVAAANAVREVRGQGEAAKAKTY